LVKAGLQAEADSDFEDIRAELLGTSGHRRYAPYIFVGLISELGPVPHVFVCKEAVNENVGFSVLSTLMGKSRSEKVKTGYVNCSNQPLLSPPFALGARVIVSCDETHDPKWDRCLTPMPVTAERLNKLRRWVAERPQLAQ
jgi:hypothetical protein